MLKLYRNVLRYIYLIEYIGLYSLYNSILPLDAEVVKSRVLTFGTIVVPGGRYQVKRYTERIIQVNLNITGKYYSNSKYIMSILYLFTFEIPIL